MNLKIDLERCARCGSCVKFCPGHVLGQDEEGRPCERFPQDCWYCGVCEVECPARCIEVIFPYLIR